MKRNMERKALALISGGLDSLLAAKIIQDQNIEVEGVTFVTPFPGCERFAGLAAKQLGIKHHIIFLNNLKIVRNPKFGYGSAANPCIDCKILFFREAKKLMKKIGASFLVTGEVIGQRPMSQMKRQMEIIEKESGLEGLIVRPLCAKHLKPSIPEIKGIVDREKLLDIKGRSRKRQIELARKFGFKYSQPSGGCILTDKNFAKKLFDLFKNSKKINYEDIESLKVGRHFRINGCKIIIGRNKDENNFLLKLSGKKIFPIGFKGPTTLIRNRANKKIIEKACILTIRYSDEKDKEGVFKLKVDNKVVEVNYNRSKAEELILFKL
ncbi:MAG: tRNA 4-thiouridine(8) synthase ThiI [Candidatus Micrarchaeia archaeon]